MQIENKLSRFLLSFIYSKKYNFFFLLLCSIIAALKISFYPKLINYVIDSLSNHTIDNESILILLFPIIGFWIFLEVFGKLKDYLFAVIFPEFEQKIRLYMFNNITRNAHSYFVKNLTGNISIRISDMPRSITMMTCILCENILPVCIATFISCSLFTQLGNSIAIILFTWITTHIYLCFILNKNLTSLFYKHSEAFNILQGKIVDSLNNNLSIKLFNGWSSENKHLEKYQKSEKNTYSKALFYIFRIKIILFFIAILFICSLLYIAFLSYQNNNMTIGEIVFVITTIINILDHSWALTDEIPYFCREFGMFSQGMEALDECNKENYLISNKSRKINITRGEIKFHKVSFQYRRNNNFIKDKSLTIKGRQKIGLVGLSGSGKTTFAHFILRLQDIDSGKITIDSQDITNVDIHSLRNNISFLPQEPILFQRSIIENVRYGNIDATDEEVFDAIRKANCHGFIMEMEDGYNTIIGENGFNLSAGQKQRIGIARVILKNAPILIIDEATASLDAKTENKIRESINFLSVDKTTIVIAHRFNTLKEVDRILVFDHGTIIEDGSHDQLLQAKELYYTLWTMQNGDILPDIFEL